LPAQPQEPPMKVGAAIAEILKREGVEVLAGFSSTPSGLELDFGGCNLLLVLVDLASE